MDTLKTCLAKLKKVTPRKSFREGARKRLMSAISSSNILFLPKVLQNLPKVLPDSRFFIAAKNRITHAIPVRVSFWSRGINKAVATMMAVCVLFVFTFSGWPTVSQAEFIPYVQVISGDIEIKHLGEEWNLVRSMEALHIGDLVRTKKGGEAELFFSNFSTSRLASNTEISVNQLTNMVSESSKNVFFELRSGKVWSQVIESFSTIEPIVTISTSNSIIEATNAVFVVEINQDTPTEVMAINHFVDVKILQNKGGAVIGKTRVSPGYKTSIERETSKKQGVSSQPLAASEKSDTWFQANKKRDIEHRNTVLTHTTKKLKEQAGITPDSPLYSAKTVLETAKTALLVSNTRGDFERTKSQFLEAAASLGKEKSKRALLLMASQKKKLETFLQTEEFREETLSFLQDMEETFRAVLPNSSLYFVKNTLREFHKNTPQFQKELALDILSETQDLIAMQENELALSHLALWKNMQKDIKKDYFNDTEEYIKYKTDEFQKLHGIIFTAQESSLIQEAQKMNMQLEGDLRQLVSTVHPEVLQINPAIPLIEKTPQRQLIVNKKIESYLDKISVYQSARGQNNQTIALLRDLPENVDSILLLEGMKDSMPESSRYLVLRKILEIRRTLDKNID